MAVAGNFMIKKLVTCYAGFTHFFDEVRRKDLPDLRNDIYSTFEDGVISIVTAIQRMATSLHIEWQKKLKLYSKNMAMIHPDTTEYLNHYLFTNKDRASYVIKLF